ncbi:hypothetical protein M3I54_07360 [Paraburkholderia sp. CNPSo 3274]|uniref:hypothetical protein n=1 Tax=Paraburkholderia sp. CNPSo 3274 TaxID=2940932 RepID=UPI0020B71972|nr:hypothetical protein [Paraburkholderia sp. CNPSo 3274]MCP3706805.1 hypothetical protein [Paraburkholderia sp. CNPSo 3274]
MTAMSRWAVTLAVGATGTAVSLSVQAGLQRGGTLPERAVWIALGIVLVVSAHLLPALTRGASAVARSVGSVLWLACFVAVCDGHAGFFLLAQRHAGALRASTVTTAPVVMTGRGLTVVMADRATVIAQLTTIDARRCSGDCRTLDGRRTMLTARLDALNAEADDVRRIEAERDRVTTQRDALLADPVTSRLAALLGTTTARVDLLSGLAFAAVLEGVACLLWTVALRQSPSVSVTTANGVTASEVMPVADGPVASQPEVTAVIANHASEAASHKTEEVSHASPDGPVTPLPVADSTDDDVARLALEVAAGFVRPTVADIRRYLNCSQARAVALRRQLAERNVPA